MSRDYDKKLIQSIEETLKSNSIDTESIEENILSKSVTELNSHAINLISSHSLKIEDLDDYFIFFVLNEQKDFFKELANLLKKEDLTVYKSFNFYFICNTLEEKFVFQSELEKKYLKDIKNLFNNIKLNKRNMEISTIFVSTTMPNKFEIKIDSRIRSLETTRDIVNNGKENIKLKLDSYVFVANLTDIVNIYNDLGNDLFFSNVRYGIEDELNVDAEIKDTLNNNPSDFWYLNNGITLVLKDDEFNLKKSNVIEINPGKDKIISVINGAQTISASAYFYYSAEYTKEAKAKAENEAKVMLRVMNIKTNNILQSNNIEEINKVYTREIDKISIALNRQKPIKPEDVAYTMPFIYTINNLQIKNKSINYYFKLIRRGEKANNGHNLVQFARAVKAYLVQEPGDARTKGSKSLLEVKNDEYLFKDTGIFRSQENLDEVCYNDIFKKYYKPVNFALELEKYYLSYIKDYKKSNKDKKNNKEHAITNYGKWHFIAYIIFVLNDCSYPDFSPFDAEIRLLNTTKVFDIIKTFIDLFSRTTEKASLESNDFKTNNIYENFRDYTRNGAHNSLKKEIIEFQIKILESFSPNQPNFLSKKKEELESITKTSLIHKQEAFPL
ncbi:AIPR family protein [Rossellomorea sp. GAMAL-10_SWC]